MSKPGDGFNIDKIAGGSNNLGSYLITSGQAVSWGQYQYLVVNEDCVFTVLSTAGGKDLLPAHNGSGTGGLNLTGMTVTKGMVIVPIGDTSKPDNLIKNVTVSSGSVLAYG